MTRFQELKKCKTLGEIYGALGEEWFEKTAFHLLVFWILLPVVMIPTYSVIYLIYRGDALAAFQNKFAYFDAFEYLGVVTLVFALFAIPALFHFRSESLKSWWKRYPWLFLLAAMLLWSCISTVLADDFSIAFSGTLYRLDGLESYFFYGAVMVCALLVRDRIRIRRLLLELSLSCSLMVALMLLQIRRVSPFTAIFGHLAIGVFFNSNHLGYYLTVCILCSAGLSVLAETRRLRLLTLLSFSFQMYGLILNDTLGCYLAVILALLVLPLFLLRGRRLKAFRAFAPLLIALLLSFGNSRGWFRAGAGSQTVGENMSSLAQDVGQVITDIDSAGRAGSGRIRLWLEALDMVKERPLFGYGPEGLTGAYTEKMGLDRPHNEYIQHAVFLGIPALCLYLAALILLAIRQWNSLPDLPEETIVAAVAAVGYLISAFFGNTMFYTTPFFWLLLGFTAHTPDWRGISEK